MEEIDFLKEELDQEIIKAVTELDETMYIAMIAFAFPVQTAVNFITSKLTGTRYVLRTASIIDFLIMACVLVWFGKFE